MFDGLILKIRRGETPFTRAARNLVRSVLAARLPLPRAVNPLLRILFNLHRGFATSLRAFNTFLFREPLFRGRCESVGKRFRMNHLPYVHGHTKIYIGDNVSFFGYVGIMSGRIFDEPRLVIGDRVGIGHMVNFVVNKEILIEDDVYVASGVSFMDSDGHPRDVNQRIVGMPPAADDIKPVRICRRAWIGSNSWIMKGVTVGEGAIVGANSVVIADVPSYTVVMGNPARVVVKNLTPYCGDLGTPANQDVRAEP